MTSGIYEDVRTTCTVATKFCGDYACANSVNLAFPFRDAWVQGSSSSSGSSGFLPMQWLPSNQWRSQAWTSILATPLLPMQWQRRSSGNSGFLPMQWQQWLPSDAVAAVASFQCSGSSGFLPMQWQQWLPSNAVAAVASF